MTEPLVDPKVALWAARMASPVGSTAPAEVATLRADVAQDLPALDAAARAWTRLGGDLPPTEARVVGRIGWVRANLAAIDGAFDPLADRIRGDRRLASRVLGAQVGALFGLLSRKVLGQFVLPLSEAGGGELVVVGPNLLELAQEHGRLAADIRRTVLVHEITHRLQFDSAEWLGEHLRSLLRDYLSEARLDASALVDAAARLPAAVRRVRESGDLTVLIETVLTPDQVEVIKRAQGLMSLLEGHGNAAMFLGVDSVVRDPEAVRTALQRRRSDVTTKLLSAVAGLEMKRRQYREGEDFVATVVDRAGVETLNRAFEGPDQLPTVEEIRAPETWLARVQAA